MTDDELRNYLVGNPTIKGIVTEMKTWWSNDGSDKILQECFDAILRIDGERDKQVATLPGDADQLISSYTIERLDKLSEQLSSIITLLKYIAEDVRKNG